MGGGEWDCGHYNGEPFQPTQQPDKPFVNQECGCHVCECGCSTCVGVRDMYSEMT